MYKVLIVEDEVPVRNRIIESVNWADIGLEVVYGAGDGQEALDFLEDHQVELILTDIYMPFIDGMELARRVRESNQYCKIVFLTGYNEFDYAKEAIELNASKYLLKPITKEELCQVLIEMKEALDQDIEAMKNLTKLEDQYEKSLSFLRDKLLFDIIAGFMPSNRIQQACRNLNCDYQSNYYRLGIIEVVHKSSIGQEQWAEDYSLLHFAMFNIAKELFSDNHDTKVLLGDQGKLYVVFTSMLAEGFEKVAFDGLSELLNTIRHIYKMPLTAGLSSQYQGLDELKYAYEEAMSAMDYSLIEGINRVIVTADIEGVTPMKRQKLEGTMTEIVACLKVNKTDEAKEHLAMLIEQVKFNRYGLNEIKTLILALMTRIFDGYNQMCLTEAMKETLDFTLVETLHYLEDFTQVEVQIQETIDRLSGQLLQSRQNDKNHLVLEAINHIETSYMHADLDIKEMSDHLHVSASYFSRIFKSAKQQTFLEFLTAYRMDKAKALLKSSDLKVYEISTAVGYEDPHYFSYNFRKNVGTTPLKFRKA